MARELVVGNRCLIVNGDERLNAIDFLLVLQIVNIRCGEFVFSWEVKKRKKRNFRRVQPAKRNTGLTSNQNTELSENKVEEGSVLFNE